jgi:hypothetical protein
VAAVLAGPDLTCARMAFEVGGVLGGRTVRKCRGVRSGAVIQLPGGGRMRITRLAFLRVRLSWG